MTGQLTLVRVPVEDLSGDALLWALGKVSADSGKIDAQLIDGHVHAHASEAESAKAVIREYAGEFAFVPEVLFGVTPKRPQPATTEVNVASTEHQKLNIDSHGHASAHRYRHDDPAIAKRDVVLASDYASLESALNISEMLCYQWKSISDQHDARAKELTVEIAELRARSTIFDTDANLSDRLKAANMLTAAEILAGVPIDAFHKHAGVHDLDTFSQWIEMRRSEYLKLHARFVLEKREDDELFDWITSHMGVFGEVMINFAAAWPRAEHNTPPRIPIPEPTQLTVATAVKPPIVSPNQTGEAQ